MAEFSAPELLKLIAMLSLQHRQRVAANRDFASLAGLGQRCHTKQTARFAFNKSAKIGQRAAESNMIIDQDVIGGAHKFIREDRRRNEAMSAISLRVPDFVRLHDRTGCDGQTQV